MENSKNTNLEAENQQDIPETSIDKSDSITDLLNSSNTEASDHSSNIYDINISSLDDIIKYSTQNEYDFFIIEPEELKAKISFRKEGIEKEAKYIRFPIYNTVILKAKNLAKLDVAETGLEQEWTWEIELWKVSYKILAKTAPSAFWEKLFFKAKEDQSENTKKTTKKTSFSTILGYLGAILTIALILWGSLISFVIFNAKTVEDVNFFRSLWISLNEINSFIATSVWIIFSALLFIEVIILIIFLFKFLLTKKQFKKLRVTRWIISFLLLFLTFSTLSAWMFIDQKINSLPNWLEESYWNVKMYDNSKLLSEYFDENSSLIFNWGNLIWPVTIKYDLSNFYNKETKSWYKIKKFIWDFWDNDLVETIEPTYIKTFDKKWTYNIKINVIEQDIHWKEIEKSIEDVQNIEISHIVEVKEESLNDWWKTVQFNASDLKELGKLEWYYIDKENKNTDLQAVYEWYTFFPSKVIYEEILIWMYIKRTWKESQSLDKVFVVSPNEENNIVWEIDYYQNPISDLEYTFKVKNLETSFWAWFVEEFVWKLDWKSITKKANLNDIELSSKLEYTFSSYWDKNIELELIDSSWNKKILKTVINIPKQLTFKDNIEFYNNSELMDKNSVKYDKNTREYFIDNLAIPTTLLIDASSLKSEDFLYYLWDVEWDLDWDWNTDETWEKLTYNINTSWNFAIWIKYSFINRKIPDEVVNIKETIYISAEKKDAILDLKMIYDSDYAPVIVAFDASKSEVKGKDISKFIFDYWDGSPVEERDAINPWHKYLKAWDYDVKLTVITIDWTQYSISKKLILKPSPQVAKIKVSMKEAPIYQWIDFSSSWSNWQINNYFWDFWDWNTSINANPTHTYTKAWVYKVKLTLEFKNQNTLSDEIEITITE